MTQQCQYIFKQRPNKGQQCALNEGHAKDKHLSEEAAKNHKLAKRRWDKKTALSGTCIECGDGCSRRAKRCLRCNNRITLKKANQALEKARRDNE